MGNLQPIRKFTAQIRKPDNETIVGTGFAVSVKPGLLVTCRHVVEAISKPCEVGTAVDIYFPLINGQNKTFSAKVEYKFTENNDDVVILKLDDETLPPGVEIAELGDANASTNCNPVHAFRSFGFRKLANYQGLPAYGTIIDFTLKPDGETLKFDPLMLESQHIDSGMSGAAVLDMERNLVVGIVIKKWNAGTNAKDEYTALALDGAAVYELSDTVRYHFGGSLPEEQGRQPTEQAQERAAANEVTFPLPPAYHPAEPPNLPEWVGRENLIKHLDEDYANPKLHITTLIGFGGEGKSSLAYKWLTGALQNDPPDAAFWWDIYDNRGFEAMLEDATTYLYGDVAKTWNSTAGRVEAIGALLREKRVLMVLDGFEVMQEQEGDRYGTISSRDILRLLDLFAQGEHHSYCLVTSRAPLLDLLNSSATVQRDVTGLEPKDGTQLLRNLEVRGDEATLKQIVSDWGGHALTISLIGAYLRDVKGGDAGEYDKSLFPELDTYAEYEERYHGMSRILNSYNEGLSAGERAFLKLFSVFRLPVTESAFERVFRTDIKGVTLNMQLVALSNEEFNALVKGLEYRRLILKNDKGYTFHPLVRNHYRHLMERENQAEQSAVHQAIARHYEKTVSYQPPDQLAMRVGLAEQHFPTLDDLNPYIEVVYHLCRAGAYDAAWHVYVSQLYQVLSLNLRAFTTLFNLQLEFYPDHDLVREPALSNPDDRDSLLHQTSGCLIRIGSLEESVPIIERAKIAPPNGDDYDTGSVNYLTRIELYVNVGQLKLATKTAAEWLVHTQQIANNAIGTKYDEVIALAEGAWIAYLHGDNHLAGTGFTQGITLLREISPEKPNLFGKSAIQYADYLHRKGDLDYARTITNTNLKICTDTDWLTSVSQCHRVLGDLDTDAGEYKSARAQYKQALTIARSVDVRDVLIEALIAYGHWQALHGGEVEAGRGLLAEALDYCTKSSYLLFEADTRVALAQIALQEGDTVTASEEASRAMAIGYRTGYHWAKVDAQAVLDQL